MKRPCLAFLLLNALFLPGAAMAVESLNVPIITNPNGNDTADVISVAASEVTPDGERLLVWVDATTRRVYAQVIDARTNAAIDAPIIVGWPQMAFSHNLPALTNGTPGPLMQYSIVNSGMPGQPRVLFHPDAEQWFVVWPVSNLQGTGSQGVTLLLGNHLIGRSVRRTVDGLELGPARHVSRKVGGRRPHGVLPASIWCSS